MDKFINDYPNVFPAQIGLVLDLEVDLKAEDSDPVIISHYLLSLQKVKKPLKNGWNKI